MTKLLLALIGTGGTTTAANPLAVEQPNPPPTDGQSAGPIAPAL